MSIRKVVRVSLGQKFNCKKCSCDIVITESMLKQRRFWCQKCKNAHIKDWIKRNPDKISHRQKATQKVRNALLSNKLKKGICIKCGNPNTEAHHEDYNKPLDVIWLCERCHIEHHREKRSKGKDCIICYGVIIKIKDILYDIPPVYIRNRLKAGWSVKKAISTPIRKYYIKSTC